jgi:hypothetical protein
MRATQTSPLSSFPSRVPATLPGGANIWLLPGEIFLIFVSVGIMAIGLYWGAIQRHRILTYVPITATITDSHIKKLIGHGKDRDTYIPVIAYYYFVRGTRYDCNRVVASGDPSFAKGEAEAQQVVTKHPVGGTSTAWYDRTNPASAFLLRQVEGFPYGLAFAPLALAMSGAYFLVISIQAGRPEPPPALDTSRWYRLCEKWTLRSRFYFHSIAVVVWYVYTGALLADYIYLDHGFDFGALFLGALALCGGVFLLRWFLQNYKLRRTFPDADVRISQAAVRLGDTFRIRVLQELKRTVYAERLSVGILCIEEKYSGYGTHRSIVAGEAWSQWKDLRINDTYEAGLFIEVEAEFTVSPTAFPTSPGKTGYRRYHWQIALGITANGYSKLTARFPIQVDPAQ